MTNEIAISNQATENSGSNKVSAYDRPVSLAAMISMTNLGAMTMLLTPALVAGYLSSGWISKAEASSLTAIELTGMSAAVVLTSLAISRIDRRLFLSAGLLIAALGHFSSALATTYHFLLASRAIAGVGIGITYAIAVAAVARTRTPDRSFGFAITANQLSVTLVLWVLSWRSWGQGHSGAMYVLLGFTLLTSCGIWWFPGGKSGAKSAGEIARQKSVSGIAGTLGLLGMFLFLLGIGGVWPFVGEIARANRIGPEAVGYALATAGFGGIGGGLLVSLIGLRFGRVWPIILGTSALATAILALTQAADPIALAICATSIMVFWIFCVPFYLGVLSTADLEGRFAVLSSAAMPFGLAAGQALANALNAERGYSLHVFVSTILLLAAVAVTLVSANMTRKGTVRKVAEI